MSVRTLSAVLRARRHRLCRAGIVLAVIALAGITSSRPAHAAWQPRFPIRAAFYYPWYTGHWRDVSQTNFHPTLGFYRSSNPLIVSKHIREMQYAHVQAGIASWWGRGSFTDTVFPTLFRRARGTGFRWAAFYEAEGYGNPSSAKIRSDLHYLRRYMRNPTYLRIRGRPVVFVWATGSDRCSTVRRWRAANDIGAYVVLKLFPHYRDCRPRPSSWYEYAPVHRSINQSPYSYTVSPGFWQHGHGMRLARSVSGFRTAVRAMVRSHARFKLVTTFNEWLEGTAVEDAAEWSAGRYGAYIEALHRNGR